MRRRLAIVAASAVAAGLAAPAAAQIAPGYSGSSSMTYLGEDQIWDVVSEFGTCYAGTSKAEALMLVATEPNSAAETATYRKLFRKPYQSCLGDVSSLQGIAISMIRGAIAEGLYRKKIPIPANLMQPVPAAGTVHNLSQASLCYVAGHPDRARALIATTRPGSKKEFEAVTALMDDFTRCIPAGARNLQFNATQIRFRLAEALLRLPSAAVTK
ncbi:MAG TPA: hypothetical protein VF574_07640 [Allosphingosinicella sp.]|jgi:hypothetical protein